MKKRIIRKITPFLVLAHLTMGSFAQTKNNDWENPQFFELNKEKPHATFMLFDKRQDVVKDDYSPSPYYQSLNGTWKFVYVDKYADRHEGFLQNGFKTLSGKIFLFHPIGR